MRNKNRLNLLTFLSVYLTLFTPYVSGQEILKLQRIQGEITIDGLSDEEAWLSIMPFKLTMNSPTFKEACWGMTELSRN